MTKFNEDGSIEYTLGDTFILDIVEASNTKTGQLINFADGWKVSFVIYTQGPKDNIIELKETDAEINASVLGALLIKIAPDKLNMSIGKEYYYDFKLTDQDGLVDTWLKGKSISVK